MQSSLINFFSVSLLQTQPHMELKHNLLIRSEVLPLDYRVFIKYLQHVIQFSLVQSDHMLVDT